MADPKAPSERIAFARRQRRMSTRCEDALWRELRGRKLGGWKFKRQAPIGPYFADFYCEAARLVVEADGVLHQADERRARDKARDAWFLKQGDRVLRFSEDEILGAIDRVIEKILGELRRTPHP